MKSYAYIVFIYAMLVLAGGLIGYLKAASMPSLFTGMTFGIMLLFCAWGVYNNYYAGVVLSMVLTALLTIFFAYRFGMTHQFMPGGLMALISVSVFTVLAIINYRSLN